MAENQKIVLRVQDLLDWIVHDVPWSIGSVGIYHEDCIPYPDEVEKMEDTKQTEDTKKPCDASNDQTDIKTEVKAEVKTEVDIKSEVDVKLEVDVKSEVKSEDSNEIKAENTQENGDSQDQVNAKCANQKLKKDNGNEVRNNHRILRNSNRNNTPSKCFIVLFTCHLDFASFHKFCYTIIMQMDNVICKSVHLRILSDMSDRQLID